MKGKLNMRNYVIITPAKNEGKYIENTLESISKQSLLPVKWIIVNDGSTDNTAEIVGKYTNKYPWIKLINNETKHEQRAGGPKIVNAFYVGYNSLSNHDYNFIVKLDADLILPHNYFFNIAKCFEQNTRVGLCGGYCVIQKNGKYMKEIAPPFSIRGAFKAYRKQAFKEIGGIKSSWHWDGLDQMALRQKGWQIQALPLDVIHLRPTSQEYNVYKHRFKSGREYYKDGHDVVLGFLRSILYGFQEPYILGGGIFFIGFIKAYLSREKKNVDRDLEKFIRKFQYKRLLKALRSRTRYV